MAARLVLKPGREKSLLRRHPWIFSGAIAHLDTVSPGDTVCVRDARGRFLAWAAANPHSQIVARVWSFAEEEHIDDRFFARRIASAVAARCHPEIPLAACRLVYGESDGLPGVIADRYGDTAVLQLSTAGAERWRDAIADALRSVAGVARVFERSDLDVRSLEGLPARVGPVLGDPPPEAIAIEEHGVRFLVDVWRGHKTGFYLDQRTNRARVATLAKDAEVLDCFCHSGGFTLHALARGARRVTAVDTAKGALAWGARQQALNGFDKERTTWLKADVFQALREFHGAGRRFDLVILDPPKFAPTGAHAQRASRAYKDINRLALELLKPGGRLATFSCSGGVDADLFQKIVAGAALDAGREAAIETRLDQAPDHPVLLSFPEASYLKGLIVRVA